MRRIFRLIFILMVAYFVFEWWRSQKIEVPKPAKGVPPVQPPPSSVPSKKSKDALTEIDGIGPAYEKALNELGIYTFAQLAAENVDELASKLSSVRINAARIRRDQWIEQASSRAQIPAVTSRWSANDGDSA